MMRTEQRNTYINAIAARKFFLFGSIAACGLGQLACSGEAGFEDSHSIGENSDGISLDAPAAYLASPEESADWGEHPEAFYEIVEDGHRIQFIEPVQTALVIAEIHSPGRRSVLAGMDFESVSVAEIFERLRPGEELPVELVDYQRRVDELAKDIREPPSNDTGAETIGSPELPAAGDMRKLQHEAGSSHFASSHCPDRPDSSTGFYFYEEHDPISTREFCWSAGYINDWTESSSAKVLTHDVANVWGSVAYTMTVEGWSGSWSIGSNSVSHFWGRNGLFWDCCFICACGDQDIKRRTMSGKVDSNSSSRWRFGGGFWR